MDIALFEEVALMRLRLPLLSLLVVIGLWASPATAQERSVNVLGGITFAFAEFVNYEAGFGGIGELAARVRDVGGVFGSYSYQYYAGPGDSQGHVLFGGRYFAEVADGAAEFFVGPAFGFLITDEVHLAYGATLGVDLQHSERLAVRLVQIDAAAPLDDEGPGSIRFSAGIAFNVGSW